MSPLTKTGQLLLALFLTSALQAQHECQVFTHQSDLAVFYPINVGYSVSIDGPRVAVGVPKAANMLLGIGGGGVLLFRYQAGSWHQEAEFSPPDLIQNDRLGQRVLLDGDQLFASTQTGTGDSFLTHRLYVFREQPGGWVEQQQIHPSGQTSWSLYGQALDKDGEWLVVGDSQAFEPGGNMTGAAFLYREVGGLWVEEQIVLPVGVHYQAHGQSVALKDDLLVVGCNFDTPWGFRSGSAYVYRNIGGVWQLEQKLIASDGDQRAEFGYSVAITGGRVFVGAPGYNAWGFDIPYQGAVHVFERSGGSWVETQILQGPVLPTEYYDLGTTMKGDRGNIIVGTGPDGHGAALVFSPSASGMELTATLVPSDIQNLNNEAARGAFGLGIDLEGRRALVSAYRRWNGSLGEVGFIYAYDLVHGTVEPYCTATPNSTGQPAELKAVGPIGVAQNELVLTAKPIPTGQPGIAYYGPTQIQIPFGNGTRCVGGFVSRLPPQPEGGGKLEFPLDATAPPTPAGLITAGSTWNFQAWYRDPAAAGSGFNLSDALAIEFCE